MEKQLKKYGRILTKLSEVTLWDWGTKWLNFKRPRHGWVILGQKVQGRHIAWKCHE